MSLFLRAQLALNKGRCLDGIHRRLQSKIRWACRWRFMSDEYSKETLALSDEIEHYAAMDVYSAERPKIVQVILRWQQHGLAEAYEGLPGIGAVAVPAVEALHACSGLPEGCAGALAVSRPEPFRTQGAVLQRSGTLQALAWL